MNNLPLAKTICTVAIIPAALNFIAAAPALAGSVFIEPVDNSSQPFDLPTARRFPSPNSDIFCSYSADTTTADRLGENSLITLVELQGNSTFRYERLLPTASTLRVSINDTVSRTLTFTDRSANQAGRRLIERPNEYAALLGLAPNDPIVRAGFEAIAPQFTCGLYNETLNAAAANQFPGSATPPSGPLATLPDGNYRVTSNAAVDPTNTDTTVTQFLFRKLGNNITGNLEYLNGGPKACIRGTIEGNTITGEASTNDATTAVLGSTYLGPSLTLQLGNSIGANRYSDAVLNLNGFDRINTGTTAPPVACP